MAGKKATTQPDPHIPIVSTQGILHIGWQKKLGTKEKTATKISHHSNVFGFWAVLQSYRTHRETNNGLFRIFPNLNSDLSSGFQHEKFNFRLFPGSLNFIFDDWFKGFRTWGTTLCIRLPIGDAEFLLAPDGPNLCYPKLKLLIDFIIFSIFLELPETRHLRWEV